MSAQITSPWVCIFIYRNICHVTFCLHMICTRWSPFKFSWSRIWMFFFWRLSQILWLIQWLWAPSWVPLIPVLRPSPLIVLDMRRQFACQHSSYSLYQRMISLKFLRWDKKNFHSITEPVSLTRSFAYCSFWSATSPFIVHRQSDWGPCQSSISTNHVTHASLIIFWWGTINSDPLFTKFYYDLRVHDNNVCHSYQLIDDRDVL